MKGTDPQEQVSSYFQQKANDYAQRSERGIWKYWKNRELNTVLSHLGNVSGLDVVEFGCGTGWYTKRLIQQHPRSYLATDYLSEMLKHVCLPGVTPQRLDLTNFTLERKFDRILCAGALEFVPSPTAFFERAARVLSASGRMVLLVPPTTIAGYVYRLWHRWHGFNIHLFSDAYLAETAARVGLTIVRTTRATGYSKVVSLEPK